MSKKKLALLLIGFLSFGGLLFVFLGKSEQNSYLIQISPLELNEAHVPSFHVEIEGKIFSAELDLGLEGDVSATKELIAQIEQKTFNREIAIKGWNSKEFLAKIYTIPKLKLMEAILYEPHVCELPKEFLQNATLEGHLEPAAIRLGWPLFSSCTLFLDLKNLTIFLCDSKKTLIKHGIELKRFAQTPLILEKNCIQFKANTPQGPLLCSLDTGATYNFLYQSLPQTQLFLTSENIELVSSFQINKMDLGAVPFYLVSNQYKRKKDAVLGMDFLLTHQVFIDFSKKQIYFAPSL